jgi:hypothetical protein
MQILMMHSPILQHPCGEIAMGWNIITDLSKIEFERATLHQYFLFVFEESADIMSAALTSLPQELFDIILDEVDFLKSPGDLQALRLTCRLLREKCRYSFGVLASRMSQQWYFRANSLREFDEFSKTDWAYDTFTNLILGTQLSLIQDANPWNRPRSELAECTALLEASLKRLPKCTDFFIRGDLKDPLDRMIRYEYLILALFKAITKNRHQIRQLVTTYESPIRFRPDFPQLIEVVADLRETLANGEHSWDDLEELSVVDENRSTLGSCDLELIQDITKRGAPNLHSLSICGEWLLRVSSRLPLAMLMSSTQIRNLTLHHMVIPHLEFNKGIEAISGTLVHLCLLSITLSHGGSFEPMFQCLIEKATRLTRFEVDYIGIRVAEEGSRRKTVYFESMCDLESEDCISPLVKCGLEFDTSCGYWECDEWQLGAKCILYCGENMKEALKILLALMRYTPVRYLDEDGCWWMYDGQEWQDQDYIYYEFNIS